MKALVAEELSGPAGLVYTDVDYEYYYAYRPSATISNGQMHVHGMSRPVRVRRL